MTRISEIKKARANALYELDIAMNKCGPEVDKMARDVEEIKIEFLTVWKKFQIKKSDEQEFLMPSRSLAKIFQSQEEMFHKFRKIITPLSLKYEKTCESFHELEVNENE